MDGYRSRDRDGILFVPAGDVTQLDATRSVRVIEADQLILVGDVDFDQPSGAPRVGGEWGRIGPEPGPSHGDTLLSPPATFPPADGLEIGKPLRHKGEL